MIWGIEMADRTVTIAICYDVSRSKTRRRVAAYLEDRMVRVQLSVFEARVTSKVANRLFATVEQMIEDGDSARLYVLSRVGLEQSKTAGGAPFPEEGAFWLL